MSIFRRQYWHNLVYGENSREQNRADMFAGLSFQQRTFAASLTMPDPKRVWGIDISHWNTPPVDLKRMKALYGLRFVIIKGCDGSVNSRYYMEHVRTAVEAGLPYGMYVWLYAGRNVPIASQVNAWATRWRESMPPLGVYIDAETTRYAGKVSNPNAADLRAAHNLFKRQTGVTAKTYTAKSFADTHLKGFDWSLEPLWIANYGVNIPALPAGANRYEIHQFSATLNGRQLDPLGNGELDGNYYFDEDKFNKIFGNPTPIDELDPVPDSQSRRVRIDLDGDVWVGDVSKENHHG